MRIVALPALQTYLLLPAARCCTGPHRDGAILVATAASDTTTLSNVSSDLRLDRAPRHYAEAAIMCGEQHFASKIVLIVPGVCRFHSLYAACATSLQSLVGLCAFLSPCHCGAIVRCCCSQRDVLEFEHRCVSLYLPLALPDHVRVHAAGSWWLKLSRHLTCRPALATRIPSLHWWLQYDCCVFA